MNYADKLGIPYVIFLGEDEVSAGVCAVRTWAPANRSRPTLTRLWRSSRRVFGSAVLARPFRTRFQST